jgi:hypothetical protein
MDLATCKPAYAEMLALGTDNNVMLPLPRASHAEELFANRRLRKNDGSLDAFHNRSLRESSL